MMKFMKLLATMLLTMYLMVACSSGNHEHAGNSAEKEHAGEEAEKKEHGGKAADEK